MDSEQQWFLTMKKDQEANFQLAYPIYRVSVRVKRLQSQGSSYGESIVCMIEGCEGNEERNCG
jgi:hypothetical protein